MSSSPPRTVTPTRTVALKPYTPIASGAVQALDVQVEHASTENTLHLRYVVQADLARLRIPKPKPPQHADELWKHTCFEAFLCARSGTAYHELNVSPSGEWALYSFDDYRKGMARANVPQGPAIRVGQSAQRLTVDVRLDLKMLPPSRAIALAAVIEDDSGSLSYWALKHPAARPDFHHAEGFALELGKPEGP